MNISYEKVRINTNKYTNLDKSKKNILILGAAKSDKEKCNIINPVTINNALLLYGKSELYNSYKNAFEITSDYNIYLCNCYTTSDYLAIAQQLIQYEFDYIVPIGIYLTDMFYNPISKNNEYYTNFFLNNLYEASSLSVLIMTEKHASLYDDIDYYLNEMRYKQEKYINDSTTSKLLSVYGSNLISTFNMLENISYSNVVLAAVLSTRNSYEYPKSINNLTVFDFDKNDIDDSNFVYFKYNKDGEDVLKGISFKALEGEKIGIIGPTGSGKSSLISLIPRLYDTTSGSVMIGNKDVRNLKINDLRKIIGVVLQDTTLFSGSIADNLRFGMEDANEEMMESATKDAQAFEFITSSNEGYNREVGQRGKNLSGGQKQRISIARTLIKNPKILILDDSSSALDMATESKLQNSIKNRMKDATVFLIAQRISAVMDSDKIIVLDNGEIAAIGTHKELIKNCEIYRSIAISQLGEEVVLNV